MRKDFKENLLNILNGVSSGVVIALVPGTLIDERDVQLLVRCARNTDDDDADAKLTGRVCRSVCVIPAQVQLDSVGFSCGIDHFPSFFSGYRNGDRDRRYCVR